MCGRRKITVCVEERRFTPTLLVKELTSVDLSILRQLRVRMSADPADG